MTITLHILVLIEVLLILSVVTYFLGVLTIKHRIISEKFIPLSKDSIGDKFISGFISLLFCSAIILIIVSVYMMIFHMNVINL
jgi:hypothetical protein